MTCQSARALGYRLPAEWADQARVWVSRPHNAETWPQCLEEAQDEFDQFVERLRPRVEVCDTQSCGIPTNDAWIRDYGPLFVTRPGSGPALAAHDFRFNSWGRKYPPWDLDDRASQSILAQMPIPVWIHDDVLEGGAIEVNGRGTVIASQSCLLDPARNRLDKAEAEQILHEALGTTHVIWLSGSLAGDDTDGHVDTVARFIGPDSVAAVRAPQGHANHARLEPIWQTLSHAHDQDRRPLHLVELPSPRADKPPLPASYANFFICNGAVFVPTFNQRCDDVALRTLEGAMPNYEIVAIPSQHLVVGLGTLHCLTMQQPPVLS